MEDEKYYRTIAEAQWLAKQEAEQLAAPLALYLAKAFGFRK